MPAGGMVAAELLSHVVKRAYRPSPGELLDRVSGGSCLEVRENLGYTRYPRATVISISMQPGHRGPGSLGFDALLNVKYLDVYCVGTGEEAGVDAQGDLAATGDRLSTTSVMVL